MIKKKYVMLCATLLYMFCFSLIAQAKVDVAIIGAEDNEVSPIKESIKRKKTSSVKNWEIVRGKIGKNKVIVVKCGSGKVNSAVTTQFVIDKYSPTYIINVGAAGAISGNLKIGDVVVGKALVQHDFDMTQLGYPKGAIDTDKNPTSPTFYKSDSNLIEKIINFDKDGNITVGVIVTGDEFVSDANKKQELRNNFDADVVEMEGAAVAQCASLNDTPFVVIRIVSDLAAGNNNEYEENKNQTGENGAKLIIDLLQNQKL